MWKSLPVSFWRLPTKYDISLTARDDSGEQKEVARLTLDDFRALRAAAV